MTFNNKPSSRRHGWIRAAAIASLGVAALAATGAAQAGGNVFWSVGVAAPGVQLGVANAPQIYAQPAPVYFTSQRLCMCNRRRFTCSPRRSITVRPGWWFPRRCITARVRLPSCGVFSTGPWLPPGS